MVIVPAHHRRHWLLLPCESDLTHTFTHTFTHTSSTPMRLSEKYSMTQRVPLSTNVINIWNAGHFNDEQVGYGFRYTPSVEPTPSVLSCPLRPRSIGCVATYRTWSKPTFSACIDWSNIDHGLLMYVNTDQLCWSSRVTKRDIQEGLWNLRSIARRYVDCLTIAFRGPCTFRDSGPVECTLERQFLQLGKWRSFNGSKSVTVTERR